MNYTSYYRPLIRFLVYSFALVGFTYMYADPDLWGHITFGREIWTQGHVHTRDHFSYTAFGHEWINHEWLMEVLLFLIYDVWGSPGLLLFRVGIGLAIIHLLSELYFSKSRNLLAYTLYFLLLPYAIGMGFAMRPQMATYLFIPMMWYLLTKYFDGQTRSLYLMPALFVLWVNCHGGVVAGFGIFCAVVLVEMIRGLRSNDSRWKPLAITAIASGLMLFVNPAGYKLLLFFADTIPQQRDIVEWFPVSLFGMDRPFFKLIVILFVISLFSKLPKRGWELVVIVCAIIFGFKHVRHSVLTVLLMTPFVPIHLGGLLDRFQPGKSWFAKIPTLGHAVLTWLILLVSASQVNGVLSDFRKHDYNILVDESYYPIYEVRLLKDNHINGNILSLMNWGQYLIWHLPDSKVSVDGRYWTVYSPDLLRQNMIFHNGWIGWEHFLTFYPHDIILTHYNNLEIENMKGWVKIFQGPRARIFVRTTKPYHPAYLMHKYRQLKFDDSHPEWHFP